MLCRFIILHLDDQWLWGIVAKTGKEGLRERRGSRVRLFKQIHSSTFHSLFWVAANLAGICMGASQSAGRALVGLLSPATRRAEFYGLWGLAVKLSAILGPLTYGLVSWISQGDHRLAILITGSYFVAGLAILVRVNVRRGRLAALQSTQY
jgi:MFS-type transporter involved in bile tolerance (Atg22 family)